MKVFFKSSQEMECLFWCQQNFEVTMCILNVLKIACIKLVFCVYKRNVKAKLKVWKIFKLINQGHLPHFSYYSFYLHY